jgi:predicted nucleic acid-binding protein
MPRPIVADTTVFIAALRGQGGDAFAAVRRGQVWLAAVVLAELYAGTRSADEARALDQLAREAIRGDRLLVPASDDWARAGRMIARHVRLWGAVRPRDHLADALVVLAAARVGGEVLTANVQHLEVWARQARRSGLDVLVSAA